MKLFINFPLTLEVSPQTKYVEWILFLTYFSLFLICSFKAQNSFFNLIVESKKIIDSSIKKKKVHYMCEGMKYGDYVSLSICHNSLHLSFSPAATMNPNFTNL